MTAGLKRLIGVARGVAPADLVLKNARVVNVLSGEILEADVAVCDGLIAGVGRYDGPVVKDLEGLYLAPGFIDGHFHIESSLLTPPQLARAVSPHGTTAVVADPHELANVLGREGIRYLIAATEGLGVDFFFMLPSCVPATDLETAGAAMTAADLSSFAGEERVLGLGEMMNFPGVVYAVEAVLEKIMAFSRRPRDGHAPLLSGRDLNAYIAAGIGSDHECTRLEEAREKLRLGMHIFIREGTSTPTSRRGSVPITSAPASKRPARSSAWGCTSSSGRGPRPRTSTNSSPSSPPPHSAAAVSSPTTSTPMRSSATATSTPS